MRTHAATGAAGCLVILRRHRTLLAAVLSIDRPPWPGNWLSILHVCQSPTRLGLKWEVGGVRPGDLTGQRPKPVWQSASDHLRLRTQSSNQKKNGSGMGSAQSVIQ